MKHHQQLMLAGCLAAALTAPVAAQAQAARNPPAAAAAGASAPDLTEAEVRKVDKSTGRITLRHGEIKNLDMPPMTMVFGVKDPAMLDPLKAGDKVRFRASGSDGKFTVTEIQAVK